jgi:hypothetical protein
VKGKCEVVTVPVFKHIGGVDVPSFIVSVGTRRNVNGQLNTLANLLPGKWPRVSAKKMVNRPHRWYSFGKENILSFLRGNGSMYFDVCILLGDSPASVD